MESKISARPASPKVRESKKLLFCLSKAPILPIHLKFDSFDITDALMLLISLQFDVDLMLLP